MNIIPFLVTPENMRAYEALVRSEGNLETPAPQEIVKLVTSRQILAWWYLEGEEKVGWCALAPKHGHYSLGAWHFFGSWVKQNRHSRDIQNALWRLRIAIIPSGTTVTVSVQEEHSTTEELAERFGFKKIETASSQPAAYLLKKA